MPVEEGERAAADAEKTAAAAAAAAAAADAAEAARAAATRQILEAGNFFEVLGVTRFATAAEIKKAYKGLSMLVHPDKNGGDMQASRAFQRLNEAKSTLSNLRSGGDGDELAGVMTVYTGPETLQPRRPATSGRQGRNRNGLRRVRSNLRGFVDVPRDEFRRLQGNKRALVNGNERSCAQDALVNAAKALGVPVTKKQVYDATLPAEGDTEMGVIIDYALNVLGIQMDDVRLEKTLGFLLFRATGGPMYALLQQTEGVFVIELRISQSGMDDDYHNVVYDADYQHVMYPGIRGAIIDNEKDTPVKFIEPLDRAEVQQARDVFHSLFPFASNVRVVGAWLMRRIPSE